MTMPLFHLKQPPIFWILVLCLLGVAELSSAQSCGHAQKLEDALKAASQGTSVLAQLPAGYSEAPELIETPLKAIRLAALASDKMCGCSGAADVASCLQASLDKKFVCDLYEISGLPDFTNPFSVLAVYFPPIGVPLTVAYELHYGDQANPYCGTGTGDFELVCCKYDSSQTYCHSGFEGPDAVNCLGAEPPHSPVQLGPVDYNQLGLPTCDHIPECVTRPAATQTPHFDALRQTDWMKDLGHAYAEAVYGGGASSCTADFATLVGCRGWLQVARAGRPYVGLQSMTQVPTGAAASAFRKDLLTVAAQRVMYGVPNGVSRHAHIASRVWTPATKAAYLGNVNAVAELSRWLGRCGLELLRSSMPDTWQLMAVAVPGEAPHGRTARQGWEDGCLQGQPPTSLEVVATRNGSVVTLQVNVTDPEAEPSRSDVNPLSIAWGDGTISGEIFRHGEGNAFSHTYSGTVTGQARLVYLNDAGLSVEHQVAIP